MIETNKSSQETIQQSFDSAESIQAWTIQGDVVATVLGKVVEISGGSVGQHQVLVKATGQDPDLQHIQITVGE